MFIETEKYKEMIEVLPIVCLDTFIVQDGKMLLWKRTNNPLKWEWCVPGWRLMIGEQVQDGIIRKIKEELWIDYTWPTRVLGTYNTIFGINSFDQHKPYHTVNIVHIIELDEECIFHKDHQNEELEFFEIKEQDFFPDYINLLIRDYLKIYG